mmetsp:Transcript_6450/g.20147  ORF Transcript_6450/g.20147 Transcript_6450/m.20147 type:complete len:291 (-) Transcript_6450:176-1048(-)
MCHGAACYNGTIILFCRARRTLTLGTETRQPTSSARRRRRLCPAPDGLRRDHEHPRVVRVLGAVEVGVLVAKERVNSLSKNRAAVINAAADEKPKVSLRIDVAHPAYVAKRRPQYRSRHWHVEFAQIQDAANGLEARKAAAGVRVGERRNCLVEAPRSLAQTDLRRVADEVGLQAALLQLTEELVRLLALAGFPARRNERVVRDGVRLETSLLELVEELGCSLPPPSLRARPHRGGVGDDVRNQAALLHLVEKPQCFPAVVATRDHHVVHDDVWAVAGLLHLVEEFQGLL